MQASSYTLDSRTETVDKPARRIHFTCRALPLAIVQGRLANNARWLQQAPALTFTLWMAMSSFPSLADEGTMSAIQGGNFPSLAVLSFESSYIANAVQL